MKKLVTIATTLVALSSVVSGDMLRVEAGVGAWGQSSSGDLSYQKDDVSGTDVSTKESVTQPYAWIFVKHFIPILPNIRLEYVGIENSGEATGKFKDFTISGNSKTTLEMKQFDVIPYYNLLDNTFWATLDVGIDFKIVMLDYIAEGVQVAGVTTSYTESETFVIPLAYVRVRTQIPTTDLGFEADVKYVTYDGSTVYDVRAKVDYTFDITPLIQPAIEVGYRVQKFDLDDNEGAKMNLEFAGVYSGISLRF